MRDPARLQAEFDQIKEYVVDLGLIYELRIYKNSDTEEVEKVVAEWKFPLEQEEYSKSWHVELKTIDRK